MPHISDQAEAPVTPPKRAGVQSPSGPAVKARMGLLPVLSMSTHKPDQRLIDEAMRMNTEVPAGGGSVFMPRR
jgi:hypothetical protein